MAEQRPQCTAGRQELWHDPHSSYLITDQPLFLGFSSPLCTRHWQKRSSRSNPSQIPGEGVRGGGGLLRLAGAKNDVLPTVSRSLWALFSIADQSKGRWGEGAGGWAMVEMLEREKERVREGEPGRENKQDRGCSVCQVSGEFQNVLHCCSPERKLLEGYLLLALSFIISLEMQGHLFGQSERHTHLHANRWRAHMWMCRENANIHTWTS